jgi:hypothetical protein
MAILTINADLHGLLSGIVGSLVHLVFNVFGAFDEESDHLNGFHQSDYHVRTFNLDLFRFIC